STRRISAISASHRSRYAISMPAPLPVAGAASSPWDRLEPLILFFLQVEGRPGAFCAGQRRRAFGLGLLSGTEKTASRGPGAAMSALVAGMDAAKSSRNGMHGASCFVFGKYGRN